MLLSKFSSPTLIVAVTLFTLAVTVTSAPHKTELDGRHFAQEVSKPLHALVPRQDATAGSNTDPNGKVNGGADSAQAAANAAGSSIDTGAGGDRSTPSTRKDFAELLSGFFFGALLTLIFGGALTVQIWHYYERFGSYGSDRLALQLIVTALLIFSLFQVGVLIHRLYDLHVGHFGDFTFPLLTIGWEVAASFVCVAFMSGLVQLYFAHRAWLAFGKARIILIPAAALIAWTFIGGVLSAILVLKAGSAANVKGQALQSFLPNSTPWKFSVIFATWLCSNVAIDVWLCCGLIYQLNKMSTPFFHTRHAVARLLLLSLETCFATTALSITSMILFLSVPYQFFYYITFLPVGQVYASSFVATLMARQSIARELAQDQVPKVEKKDAIGVSETGTMQTAPKTLVRPVLKRIMRKEDKKRPRGDVSRIQMTTMIDQTISKAGEEFIPSSAKANSDATITEHADDSSEFDLDKDNPKTVSGNKREPGSPFRQAFKPSSSTISISPGGIIRHPFNHMQPREAKGHDDINVNEFVQILASDAISGPNRLDQMAKKATTKKTTLIRSDADGGGKSVGSGRSPTASIIGGSKPNPSLSPSQPPTTNGQNSHLSPSDINRACPWEA